MSHSRRTLVSSALLALLVAPALSIRAEPETPIGEPITAVEGVAPGQDAFVARGWSKPHVINTAEEAVKVFGEEGAAKLAEQVDFEKRFVLVFAWRGSGGDKLTYAVAESFPEQIKFAYKPGMTRDLRPHVHVYSLRKNVTWDVTAQRPGR